MCKNFFLIIYKADKHLDSLKRKISEYEDTLEMINSIPVEIMKAMAECKELLRKLPADISSARKAINHPDVTKETKKHLEKASASFERIKKSIINANNNPNWFDAQEKLASISADVKKVQKDAKWNKELAENF
jgi:uncharacterized coiled-coil protein SlyX